MISLDKARTILGPQHEIGDKELSQLLVELTQVASHALATLEQRSAKGSSDE